MKVLVVSEVDVLPEKVRLNLDRFSGFDNAEEIIVCPYQLKPGAEEEDIFCTDEFPGLEKLFRDWVKPEERLSVVDGSINVGKLLNSIDTVFVLSVAEEVSSFSGRSGVEALLAFATQKKVRLFISLMVPGMKGSSNVEQ